MYKIPGSQLSSWHLPSLFECLPGPSEVAYNLNDWHKQGVKL